MRYWTSLVKPGVSLLVLMMVLGWVGLNSTRADTLDQQFFHNDSQDRDRRFERDEADRLLRLGQEQEAAGQVEQAIASWQEALAVYERIGDVQAQGKTYEYIGLSYISLGRLAEAEDALRRGLAIARDRQDAVGQIDSLNHLGMILVQQRYPQVAQGLFQESLTIARQVGNAQGEGLSLSNLGLAAAAVGNANQAIELYEMALPFLYGAPNPRIEAMTLNRLGDAYRSSNRLDDAFRNYLAAYRLSGEISDRANRYRAIDSLVSVYQARQQFPQVYEFLEERFEMAQADQNQRQQLATARSLAEFYVQTGDRTLARAFYRQAIGLAQRLQDRREESTLRLQLANLGSE